MVALVQFLFSNGDVADSESRLCLVELKDISDDDDSFFFLFGDIFGELDGDTEPRTLKKLVSLSPLLVKICNFFMTDLAGGRGVVLTPLLLGVDNKSSILTPNLIVK